MGYLKIERRLNVYFDDFYNDNNNDYNDCNFNKFIKKKKLGMFLYRRLNSLYTFFICSKNSAF